MVEHQKYRDKQRRSKNKNEDDTRQNRKIITKMVIHVLSIHEEHWSKRICQLKPPEKERLGRRPDSGMRTSEVQYKIETNRKVTLRCLAERIENVGSCC